MAMAQNITLIGLETTKSTRDRVTLAREIKEFGSSSIPFAAVYFGAATLDETFHIHPYLVTPCGLIDEVSFWVGRKKEHVSRCFTTYDPLRKYRD